MIWFELIQKFVDENLYFYQCDVECIVNFIFEEIIEVMVCGDWVELCGFGVFLVKQCDVCVGCNLCIGEFVVVEEKYVLFFKIGKFLRDCLNGKV